MCQGGLVDLSPEHSGELPATLLAFDSLDARDRPPDSSFSTTTCVPAPEAI
jgi:hypothetical protein